MSEFAPLNKNENIVKLFLEHAPAAIAMFDTQMRYVAVSQRWISDYGIVDKNIIGKSHYDIFPEITDHWKNIHQRGLAGEVITEDTEPFTRQDGTTQWIKWEVRPWRNADNTIGGIIILTEDITQSKEDSIKIQEELEYRQKLLENSNDGIAIINQDFQVIDANQRFADMLGYTKDELFSLYIWDIDATMSEPEIRERFFNLSDIRVLIETRHRRKDGSIYDADVSIGGTIIDGRPILITTIRDIPERNKMVNALMQSEKMLMLNSRQAAMGEMISMIAHQWRQPLNIMGLAIANVQTKEALNILTQPELEENFNIISSNISHMSNTIDDFRNYLKPIQEKESVVMQSVFNIVLEMVGKSFEHNNITLSVQNNSHSPLLLHKSKLIQVLLNLLDNAKYALISNKVASVSLSVDETEDMIRISVCDNGMGISKEAMEHLGEPYFTTKKLNGTGLGLHIAKTIMENYFGGTLTWHNEKQGACFLLTFKAEYV